MCGYSVRFDRQGSYPLALNTYYSLAIGDSSFIREVSGDDNEFVIIIFKTADIAAYIYIELIYKLFIKFFDLLVY